MEIVVASTLAAAASIANQYALEPARAILVYPGKEPVLQGVALDATDRFYVQWGWAAGKPHEAARITERLTQLRSDWAEHATVVVQEHA